MSNTAGALTVAFIVWFLTQQFQRERRLMSPAEVRDIIDAINRREFNGWFRPDDVMAIVKIESNFDPDARRMEPHISNRITPDGDASLGLMQVLFSTAHDRGHRGGPAALMDPVVNVRMGMRQLQWSWEFLERNLGRAPTLEQWIGSYNAGVGNVLKGIIPTPYVNRWKNARQRIKQGAT